MSDDFDLAMRDALRLDAEKLEALTGDDHTPRFFDACPECQGLGWVLNPHAHYTMDYCEGRATGVYSTNDPEEIDCPTCGGGGFVEIIDAPKVSK